MKIRAILESKAMAIVCLALAIVSLLFPISLFFATQIFLVLRGWTSIAFLLIVVTVTLSFVFGRAYRKLTVSAFFVLVLCFSLMGNLPFAILIMLFLLIWWVTNHTNRTSFFYAMLVVGLFALLVLSTVLEQSRLDATVFMILDNIGMLLLLSAILTVFFAFLSISLGIRESIHSSNIRTNLALIFCFIILSILLYFSATALTSGGHVPERCFGPAGLDCMDKALIENGVVRFFLRNNIGEDIELLQDFTGEGDCIEKGKLEYVRVDGKYYREFPVTVPAGSDFTVEADCEIQNEGRTKMEITLSYKLQDGREETADFSITGIAIGFSRINKVEEFLWGMPLRQIIEILAFFLPWFVILLALYLVRMNPFLKADAAKLGIAVTIFLVVHLFTGGVFLSLVEYRMLSYDSVLLPNFFTGPITLAYLYISAISYHSYSKYVLVFTQIIDFAAVYLFSCFLVRKFRRVGKD